MIERVLYCPRCGDVLVVYDNKKYYCVSCSKMFNKQKMYDTKHNKQYFSDKYFKKVGKTVDTILAFNFKEEVRKEFVYNNPLYNEKDVNKRIESDNRIRAINRQSSDNILEENNIPKCPTCGSTNIEKISTIWSQVYKMKISNKSLD
ncbi:MAG: hypothetical protein ACFWUC_12610 [Oscillospiraceae bacterium]|jgi:DNA-directed RNA polymerase subunit M/transcription elongation factor TFIIS